MIFALETNTQALDVFPDETAAISCCEGIDVEDGIWIFWDDGGIALFAEFVEPNKRKGLWVTNGTYHLVQNPEMAQTPLLEALEHIAAVEGQPPFNTITSIKQYLISRSRKTPA
jgi:hypothetical protein